MRPLMDANEEGQARALEFLDGLLVDKPALMIDTRMDGWAFRTFLAEPAD